MIVEELIEREGRQSDIRRARLAYQSRYPSSPVRRPRVKYDPLSLLRKGYRHYFSSPLGPLLLPLF